MLGQGKANRKGYRMNNQDFSQSSPILPQGKVSLNEVRALLQTILIELSTELTLRLDITIDNEDEKSPLPKPRSTLSTLIKFLDAKDPKKEHSILADDATISDILTVDDVSEALNISLDAPIWDIRFLDESEEE